VRVRAYRNLNAPKSIGVEWSIVPLDGVGLNLRRKVCCYASSVDLQNARFHCQAGGAAKIRENGVRSVVAFVEGDLIAATFTRTRLLDDLPDLPDGSNTEGSRVRFRVFDGYDYFTDEDQQPIYAANSVRLTDTGLCFA